jgi:GGDEF domain-containing protein
MISIKRFLEQRLLERRCDATGPDPNLVEALMQMGRLLLDAMATHMVRGNETDFRSLGVRLNGLARQMDGQQSAMTLLGISSDAVEALETYCQHTTAYLREQHEERQAMIAMLTDTVAELSGQTDASVAGLQAIEKQVERASEVDDIRTLRANLGDSLHALREAAAQQRINSAATVERLQGQIAAARARTPEDPAPSIPAGADLALIPQASDGPVESLNTSYVAAFRLQRADHIASRFGETVKHGMLTLIATQLKTVLGPADRLLRWKRTSFVMFINSAGAIQEVRTRLAGAVAATSQQYFEVGRNSAMLSVGVDWIVFPQSNRPLDAVFTEVDAFLANDRQTPSPAMVRR